MKIIVFGATGRMGQNIIAAAERGLCGAEVAAKVDPRITADEATNCYTAIADFKGEADAVIDFSHHSSTKELLNYCTERKLPVVIATTAHTPEELAMIDEAAKVIPVFHSANMSIGVAMLCDLGRRAAAAFPDADIEIIEIHHNQKLDVPSGTALLLAKGILEERPEAELVIGRHENGKRKKTDIGVHSLRLGSEVGTHEIIISTGAETISLKHKAENRALFADGAIKAAEFICGKEPGMYDMKKILA